MPYVSNERAEAVTGADARTWDFIPRDVYIEIDTNHDGILRDPTRSGHLSVDFATLLRVYVCFA